MLGLLVLESSICSRVISLSLYLPFSCSWITTKFSFSPLESPYYFLSPSVRCIGPLGLLLPQFSSIVLLAFLFQVSLVLHSQSLSLLLCSIASVSVWGGSHWVLSCRLMASSLSRLFLLPPLTVEGFCIGGRQGSCLFGSPSSLC